MRGHVALAVCLAAPAVAGCLGQVGFCTPLRARAGSAVLRLQENGTVGVAATWTNCDPLGAHPVGLVGEREEWDR